jgi:hypothetical protein
MIKLEAMINSYVRAWGICVECVVKVSVLAYLSISIYLSFSLMSLLQVDHFSCLILTYSCRGARPS